MRTISLAFALLIGTAEPACASPQTTWEQYLETLDPIRAAKTTSLAYSRERLPEQRLSDLLLLGTQVAAGDLEAYRLALRLAESASPGEVLETLAEMISKLVRMNPRMFLREQVGARHCFGVDFLGPNFVDRPDEVLKHELNRRRLAIQTVNDPALRKIQQTCLAQLR